MVAVQPGGFKGLQCFLRNFRQKDDRWNAFIAAFAAAFALGFDIPYVMMSRSLYMWLVAVLSNRTLSWDVNRDRRTTIALWLFARALDLAWRSGVEHKYLPSIPHGDVLAFAISSCQVMYVDD